VFDDLQQRAVRFVEESTADLVKVASSGSAAPDDVRERLASAARSLVVGVSGDAGPAKPIRRAASSLLMTARDGIEGERPSVEGTRLTLESGKVMLAAGDIEGAAGVARSMLAMLDQTEVSSWNYGNIVHDAHVMQGLVLFAEGKTREASVELVLAGSSTGSPQLNSFGPDLVLAWQLLAVEGEAVLTYLRSVSAFWSPR
jgi:hypothetical protein